MFDKGFRLEVCTFSAIGSVYTLSERNVVLLSQLVLRPRACSGDITYLFSVRL